MRKTLITSTAITAIFLSLPAVAQPASPTDKLNNTQLETIHAQHGMLVSHEALEEAKHEYKKAVEEELDELNEIASILIDAEELYTDAANMPDGENWQLDGSCSSCSDIPKLDHVLLNLLVYSISDAMRLI